MFLNCAIDMCPTASRASRSRHTVTSGGDRPRPARSQQLEKVAGAVGKLPERIDLTSVESSPVPISPSRADPNQISLASPW